MKKFGLLLNLILLLPLGLIAGSCSKEENVEGKDGTFGVSSTDLVCDYSKTVYVNVPFAGKDYKINVTSSGDVTWSADIVSGDIVTVTPQGEQKGDGEITISVAANPDKTPGKKAEVLITNSLNENKYRFVFEQIEKILYIPDKTYVSNDPSSFDDENSAFNKKYMKEGDNVALFWEKSLGRNPQAGPRPFNPDKMLSLLEDAYNFMKNELHFCNVTNSITDKYKLLAWVHDDNQTGATGGGNYPVGEINVRPEQDESVNLLYHEISHSFQFMSEFEGSFPRTKNWWMQGGPYEMTSQWTLLRRSPNWIDQEYNHFELYIAQSHLSFACTENQYENPYMFEYWANKHGVDIMSRLWLEGQNEDLDENSEHGLNIVKIYKRITNITQEQLNAEMYDAAARFMTWDIPTIEEAYAARGANAHTCVLKKRGETYTIVPERCPGNYGYNGIKLKVPSAGTKIEANFKGILTGSDFAISDVSYAEWRYGIVAVLKDGSRIYGEPSNKQSGTVSMDVPENTAYLWLVVAATPKKIFDINSSHQWPYQFTLKNTEPDTSKCTVVE